MGISKESFGRLSDGRAVSCYTLSNADGMKARIIDYGAALVSLYVKDRDGRLADIVAGYDDISHYEFGDGYLGAVVGRVGNRIARGCFTLNGVKYDDLYINNGSNHLHGGKCGFSNKIWRMVSFSDGDSPSLTLEYISPDGEEGYPGKLSVQVRYTLGTDNSLTLRYKATTDKPTILNLTNHSYFNLGGYASGDIFDHVLKIDADTYLPTDEELIPTGEIRAVNGTAFDFTKPKAIGKDFSTDDKAPTDMKLAGGYDHCFNFTENQAGDAEKIIERISVRHPGSGRIMRVLTNQPCVQFYTANFLCNPEHPLKGGYPQQKQHAFCLETQHMPDSINHENFTDTVLNPGECYDYTTTFVFSTFIKD